MNVPTGVPRQLTVATGEHSLIIKPFEKDCGGFFRDDFTSGQTRALCLITTCVPRGGSSDGSRQKRYDSPGQKENQNT